VSETKKGRIIVAEDDDLTRQLLQRQLRDAGYEVSAFPHGRAALQPICELGNGIVIADWSMPVMDGLALCRAVRDLQDMQALGNIHLIMLTAFDTKEKVVEGLDAGANDYLTKPYHLGELLARVQVGERMLRLQEELVRRNVEVQKANAQMAVLASKLEHMANTDVLTGLPNRRCLFERFEEIWKTAELDDLPLSCLMLDLDKFKNVNDTHGHAAGDQVLKRVADVIRRHTRQPELCGRFGGEEFVLIFPAAPVATAAVLAEALRADIAAESVVCEGTTVAATISCGVAEKNATIRCPDELIRNSDSMLYLAKEHGRNQTWMLEGGVGRPVKAGVAGSGVAAEEFTGHPPASPIRSGPRVNPLQCIDAHPDHKR
jgi:diguanylate cyclase (GGDEF)-like protein